MVRKKPLYTGRGSKNEGVQLLFTLQRTFRGCLRWASKIQKLELDLSEDPLNLSILLSGGKKLTRIPLVMANEEGTAQD